MSTGIEAIAAERRRQIEDEGWSEDHDDEHTKNEMAQAAACYLRFSGLVVPTEWPWHPSWWKPKDARSRLVRAGALIAAEIDRLDRLKRKL